MLLMLLASCHSSKSAFPNDPIYDAGRTSHSGGKKQNVESEIKIKDNRRRSIVQEAYEWLGTPYKWAGESRSGTDCSGMVMKIYKDCCGIKLPRNSAEQQKACKSIKKGSLQPGDLVFFATGKDKKRVSHVGIFVGGDSFIHATTSRGVVINHLSEQYYTRAYIGAGRVL